LLPAAHSAHLTHLLFFKGYLHFHTEQSNNTEQAAIPLLKGPI